VSDDGGRTWPEKKNVVQGFFGYSALIQLDAETIELFYEANHYKDVRLVALPVKLVGTRTRNSSEEYASDNFYLYQKCPKSCDIGYIISTPAKGGCCGGVCRYCSCTGDVRFR
jgi:hypothetical protein